MISLPLISLLGLASAIPSQIALNSDKHHKDHKFVSESEHYDYNAAYAFSGVTTFHRLPHESCLSDEDADGDILVVGAPFDTATSYRTGTRFGPNAIRQGSRAVGLAGAFSYRQNINPFKSWASIVDCGDFPITPFDNGAAFAQIEDWYDLLLSKPVKNDKFGIVAEETGRIHPRIVTLGGDHSITLPILRSLAKVYGKVSVLHVDAHIDTWHPEVFAGAHGAPSEQAKYADGTPLYWAAKEGLITDTNVHAGIRSLLDSGDDMVIDKKSGFYTIPASAIYENGTRGIIEAIREALPHDSPVYVSFDVDSLDPAYAPGTAGPAAGGWSTGEAIQILIHALKDLQIVGLDVVEVLPGMDSAGEITGIAAAEITFELLARLVTNELEQ